MDNPFFRFVGKVTDLVWLNILTLICCIPLFTAGAAFSAMYHVLIKMALHEDGVITKAFFKAFKDNFKNATIVFVPCILIFLVLFCNMYLIYQGILSGFGNLYIAVGISIGIIAIAVIMFLNYYLPLIARYDNGIKQTVKNAALLIIAFFPRSLCMLIIWLFPIALMTISDYFLIFWFIYGFSLPGFFNSMLLGQIFNKIDDKKDSV